MCEGEAAKFDWSESQNRHLPISKSTENSFVKLCFPPMLVWLIVFPSLQGGGLWRSHPSTQIGIPTPTRQMFSHKLTRGDEVASASVQGNGLTWACEWREVKEACNVFSHSACFHWPVLWVFTFFFQITTRWHDSISVGVCVALSVALGPVWKSRSSVLSANDGVLKRCNCGQSYFAMRDEGISGAPVCLRRGLFCGETERHQCLVLTVIA